MNGLAVGCRWGFKVWFEWFGIVTDSGVQGFCLEGVRQMALQCETCRVLVAKKHYGHGPLDIASRTKLVHRRDHSGPHNNLHVNEWKLRTPCRAS